MRLITVEDKTSKGTFKPTELNDSVQALKLQTVDFNTSPWVEHGYCEPIRVESLGVSAPPIGAWNLILLDDTSVKGALGFHEDTEGSNIPVSYCTVKEAREDDVAPSEVASHELLEMAVNPFVSAESDLRVVNHNNKDWIVEVCDPLEGCGYKVSNGVEVSNFVWPKWFGLEQTRTGLSQVTGYVFSPFQLPDTGYISTKEPGKEWQQVFGYKRTSLPPWADRLHRIK